MKVSFILSFTEAPCEEVAAIVVSDIIERLLPNIDPPITAPTPTAQSKAPFCAKLTAIGVISAITPIDVPIALEIKVESKNIPGSNNLAGRNRIVKLVITFILPSDSVTVENAPANRKIKHTVRVVLLPIPFIRVSILC
ncbi:hypothetical protein wNi1_00900 [Wolbachia pipientis]|nr:hypothetical protein wHmt_00980 [Wolbachia pipientis]BDG77112.1 hypothetical protein wHmc_02440 [Wolbachia pipientis]